MQLSITCVTKGFEMNLRIIIDKSLFQSLSNKALSPLDRHFDVVIPPILIKEILGDLSVKRKIKEREIDMEAFVSKMADRFGVNSIVCHNYKTLLFHALIGYPTPMDGRIVAAGLTPVKTADGKTGFKVLETDDDRSLTRWQQQQFTVEEAFWSYRWQKIKQFISTKFYLKKLDEMGVTIAPFKSLEELNNSVENILNNPNIQGRLLGMIHREFQVPYEIQKYANLRWFYQKRPLLRDFAPYAAYCLKANLLLAIGKCNENILGGSHEHDLRDLEYCYYLPFCEIFASDDKIHRKLIELLMRPDQEFIGRELGDDLQRLGEYWHSLTLDQKVEHSRIFGFRPPPDENSIVRKLWEKFRPDYDPGNVIVPKQGGQFHELIKELHDKVKDAQTRESVDGVPEGSFLLHSRSISKKKLKELFPDVDIDKI
jgi:hypothetical protein